MIQQQNFLDKFFGYEGIKEELFTIRSWFLNEKYTSNSDFLLPKGILFYGEPGNGKTLLLREYARTFNAPIFNIDGRADEDVGVEIHNIFEKARNEKIAIVTIDELDNLVYHDLPLERVIKQEIDGINQNGHILVLATANEKKHLSESLLRNGRFDRKICINNPNDETLEKIFRKTFEQFNIDSSLIDFKLFFGLVGRCSGAEVKLICNDLIMRYGNQKITNDMLEKSYDIIGLNRYEDIDYCKYKNYQVAIHEAGHILMLKKYDDTFRFYKANFSEFGGLTRRLEVEEGKDCLNFRIAEIQINLGGFLAEKLIFKNVDIGSYCDMQNVNYYATRLIERSCIFGVEDFNGDCVTARSNRSDSERHQISVERKKNKFIKKISKEAIRYLRKNKKILLAIADKLFANGKIDNNEVNSILSNYKLCLLNNK